MYYNYNNKCKNIMVVLKKSLAKNTAAIFPSYCTKFTLDIKCLALQAITYCLKILYYMTKKLLLIFYNLCFSTLPMELKNV